MLNLRKNPARFLFNIFKNKSNTQQEELPMETYANQMKKNIENAKQEIIEQRSVLPDKKSFKKNTVFLELEGILYQTFTPHINEGYLYMPKRDFDHYLEVTSPAKQLYLIHIYLRPGWKEFLNYIQNNFETILYSRSEKFYTDKVLETIGNKNFDFIQYRMYQEYCSQLQVQDEDDIQLIKIIEGLNRDLKSSLLVDIQSIEAIIYPKNYIPVQSYDATKDFQKEDIELQVLQGILEKLKDSDNVQEKMNQLFNNEKLLKELEII